MSKKARPGFRDISFRSLAVAVSVLVLASLLPAQTVETLARAYREKPSAAKQAALLQFAAAHPRDPEGALALLAAGVTEAEQGSYADAARHLAAAKVRLPQLGDYVSFYLGSARSAAKDFSAAAAELELVGGSSPASPLAAKASLLAAQARVNAGDAAEAVRILKDRYAQLPQPGGALALAAGYEGTGEPLMAVDYYQRVYYNFPDKPQSAEAATALDRLRQQVGPSYPPPMPRDMLARAQKWLDAGDHSRARTEFESLTAQLAGAEREQAQVGVGVADYLAGETSSACQYLDSLHVDSEYADAKRLYYLVACQRRLGDGDRMGELVARLSLQYPQSEWRLKALVWAANNYLLTNKWASYEPLYQACFEAFPGDPMAEYCHWKIVWNAYLHRRPEAESLLRDHLRQFPGGEKSAPALYFLGRLAERAGQAEGASALYRTILERYPGHYYLSQAEQRLDREPLPRTSAANALQPLEGISLPNHARQADFQPTAATRRRIERARLLASAGLNELAENELRFGAKDDAQPHLLAMELARAAARRGAYDQSIRYVKALVPDYLSLAFDSAPVDFWKLAFPLPYRSQLEMYCRLNKLDPYLMAGLIRQESEFNPKAVSHARAYGLTQVLPSTGRLLSRKLKVRFRTSMLFRPDFNLRLGTYYLRSMLDEFGGKVEPALASYNGGKNRVDEWLTWAPYEEPADFVETIPLSETRGYVQAVLRNAAMYRRLYAAEPAKVTSTNGTSPKPAARRKRKSTR